jgi:hypothetical protein
LIDVHRSDLLPNNIDELKWLKTHMGQLKDDLSHTRHETGEKLSSMEEAINLLRFEVEVIDDRFDKMLEQMTSVSVSKFSLNKYYSLFDI